VKDGPFSLNDRNDVCGPDGAFYSLGYENPSTELCEYLNEAYQLGRKASNDKIAAMTDAICQLQTDLSKSHGAKNQLIEDCERLEYNTNRFDEKIKSLEEKLDRKSTEALLVDRVNRALICELYRWSVVSILPVPPTKSTDDITRIQLTRLAEAQLDTREHIDNLKKFRDEKHVE
jgi:hypothetical protein